MSILNMTEEKAENWLAWTGAGNIHLLLIHGLWLTHHFSAIPSTLWHLHLVGFSCDVDAYFFRWSHLTRSLSIASLPLSSTSLPILLLANMITVECLISKKSTKWCLLHSRELKYWNCRSCACASPALIVSTHSGRKEYLHSAEFWII